MYADLANRCLRPLSHASFSCRMLSNLCAESFADPKSSLEYRGVADQEFLIHKALSFNESVRSTKSFSAKAQYKFRVRSNRRERTRTADPLVVSETLYQLSYAPRSSGSNKTMSLLCSFSMPSLLLVLGSHKGLCSFDFWHTMAYTCPRISEVA